jgi:hypothetical protein
LRRLAPGEEPFQFRKRTPLAKECTALPQLGVLKVERACVRFCSSQEPYVRRLSTYISGMFEAAKKQSTTQNSAKMADREFAAKVSVLRRRAIPPSLVNLEILWSPSVPSIPFQQRGGGAVGLARRSHSYQRVILEFEPLSPHCRASNEETLNWHFGSPQTCLFVQTYTEHI